MTYEGVILFAVLIFIVGYILIQAFSILEKPLTHDIDEERDIDSLADLIDRLWDKLICQAIKESNENESLEYWIPSFKKMKEGDQHLFKFLKDNLTKKEKDHISKAICFSGVFDFVNEATNRTTINIMVRALEKGNSAVSTSIDNYGLVKKKIFSGVKSFSDNKVNMLKNFLESNNEVAG
tara:strand:+ start:1093 stop:1632 length:540 start_codon:yes stop_codon:yes gene_type:complete